MILLSRLIKSHYTSPEKEQKIIKLRPLFSKHIEEESAEEVLAQLKAAAERELELASIKADQIIDEANAQLQEAKEEIRQLRESWEAERIQYIQQAEEEGYHKGFKQGESEAKESYTNALQEAKSIVEKTKNDIKVKMDESEETILKLGLNVAEKIIGKQLDENKEDFIYLVKQAIKEVKDHSDVNILVHPAMYEIVVSQKDELNSLFNHDKHLYIYPDEELKEHDCIVESSFGRIEASVDSQLNELKVKLFDLLGEE